MVDGNTNMNKVIICFMMLLASYAFSVDLKIDCESLHIQKNVDTNFVDMSFNFVLANKSDSMVYIQTPFKGRGEMPWKMQSNYRSRVVLLDELGTNYVIHVFSSNELWIDNSQEITEVDGFGCGCYLDSIYAHSNKTYQMDALYPLRKKGVYYVEIFYSSSFLMPSEADVWHADSIKVSNKCKIDIGVIATR